MEWRVGGGGEKKRPDKLNQGTVQESGICGVAYLYGSAAHWAAHFTHQRPDLKTETKIRERGYCRG
jgi:hypothetical protein